MKKLYLILLSTFLLTNTVTFSQINKSTTPLDSIKKINPIETSYAFGVYFGHSLLKELDRMPGANEISVKEIMKGIEDILIKKKNTLSMEDAYGQVSTFLQMKEKELKEKTKRDSESFLAENIKKEGVKSTKSGLQYMIITEGKGICPTVEDTVMVHYRGTLIDGTEFDSSYKNGEPIKFNPLQVIPGWTEGLCLLPEGTKARLFIPYNLAYGERGVGNKIPPYSTLIFDIEMLKVIKGESIPLAEEKKSDTEKNGQPSSPDKNKETIKKTKK